MSGRFLKVGSFKSTEIVESDDKFFATQAQLQAIAANTQALQGKADVPGNKGALVTSDGNGNQVSIPPGANNGQILVSDNNQTGGLIWANNPNLAYTTTTAPYVQPAIDVDVSVSVGSSVNFINGQYLEIEVGGLYQIHSIPTSTSLILTYKGRGVNETVSVSSGQKVTPTGPAGQDGASSQTVTTENFIVPAIGSTVDISVASSSPFNTSVDVNISSAGNYVVTGLTETTMTARNLGGDTNAVPGVTIASGSKIIITGASGRDGSVEATSSVNYTSAIIPPSTGSEEWKDFVDSSNNNRRSLRLPGNGAVKVYAFKDTSFPQLFLASGTAPSTLATQQAFYPKMSD